MSQTHCFNNNTMDQDSIRNFDPDDELNVLNNSYNLIDFNYNDEQNDFIDPTKEFLGLNPNNECRLEDEIDKNRSNEYNQNYFSIQSTNDSTNVSNIVIKDYSNFVSQILPNNCEIILNNNEKYEANENVGEQNIVNEENKFSQTVTIKINVNNKPNEFFFPLFEDYPKITENVTTNERDNLNTYLEGILNQMLNSVKQLDKNVYKQNYEILNSLKKLYIEFKNNVYGNIDEFEKQNQGLIKIANIKRSLKIYSYKFAKDFCNNEIQKLNLKIGELKNIKYSIKECIGKKMIENLFHQPLRTIFNNPIDKKEISIISNIEEDHNKKIIKQLKKINNPFINNLLNTKFSDIFYIYVFGNEELKNKNKELSFLEDDLANDGRYFRRNKEEEYNNKKRLMIKIFAYKFNLLNMKSRKRVISDNLFEKLKHTSLYNIAKKEKKILGKKRKKD